MLSSTSSPSNSSSRIPAASSTVSNSSSKTANSDALRSRNNKKDGLIRAKADHELKRKSSLINQHSLLSSSFNQHSSHPLPSSSVDRRAKPNTVASLRPSQPLLVVDTAFISQAALLMAAKKQDAVLVVTSSGSLCGILTDKDVTYRLVAESLDARSTQISQIMTPNPTSVHEDDERSDALTVMTTRRFRHLPVVDCEERVSGLLDITKCVFERLAELEKRVDDDVHVICAMESLEKSGAVDTSFAENVKKMHGCPDLSVVMIDEQAGYPAVSMKATVREAARTMKAHHATGVLILDDSERLVGIFTTKDVCLRVIAVGLEPSTTTVIRVMTHNPDSVDVSTTLLEALKRMHTHHYLHLPVTHGSAVCGLVDVQQLTMAMLTYLMDKSNVGASAEGDKNEKPQWNAFWSSTLANGSMNESVSERMSAHQSVSEFDRESVRESMSLAADTTSMSLNTCEDVIGVKDEKRGVAVKIKDTVNGRVFRLTHTDESLTQLLILVKDKLAVDEFAFDGVVGLWYRDEEGDCVDVQSEEDLAGAVEGCNCGKVVLWYGEKVQQEKRVREHSVTRAEKMMTSVDAVKVVVVAGFFAVAVIVAVRMFK